VILLKIGSDADIGSLDFRMFAKRLNLASEGQLGAVFRKIISQSLMKSNTIDFVLPIKTPSLFIKHSHNPNNLSGLKKGRINLQMMAFSYRPCP